MRNVQCSNNNNTRKWVTLVTGNSLGSNRSFHLWLHAKISLAELAQWTILSKSLTFQVPVQWYGENTQHLINEKLLLNSQLGTSDWASRIQHPSWLFLTLTNTKHYYGNTSAVLCHAVVMLINIGGLMGL